MIDSKYKNKLLLIKYEGKYTARRIFLKDFK